MNTFINCLKRRQSVFQIKYYQVQNVSSLLKKDLLDNPNVLTTIKSFTYSYIKQANETTVNFNITYHIDKSQSTFIVKDEFELTTAIFMILKSHKNSIKIIIDNKSKFARKETIFDYIKELQKISGVEFEQSQRSLTSSVVYTFFNQEILVCEFSYQYFDNIEMVNELSCIVAEHALIALKTHRTPISIVNYLMNWFRQNVTYKNNNLQSDHSAVGLIKNGTAVCQGIAVYAYLFLNYCGVKTRYVGGEGDGNGGWGPHAWNLIWIDGEWKHIDYTFELNSYHTSVFHSLSDFARNHKWDSNLYGEFYSNKMRKVLETLQASILAVIPNQCVFSINGCVICIPTVKSPAPVINGNIMIAILEIISFIGGCYNVVGNKIYIYIGLKKYCIVRSTLHIYNGVLYLPISQMERMGFKLSVCGSIITIKKQKEET